MTTEETLKRLRGEVLERLRRAAPEDTAELVRIDLAIEAIQTPRSSTIPQEFAGLEILSAARLYLQRINHPISEPEMIRVLIEGGIRSKGTRPPEWRIAHSLSYHASRGNLRIENQMISLPEWQ